MAAAIGLIAAACKTAAPAGATFGEYADAGKTVFAAKCAKCHGDQGQGVTAPPIMGPSASLGKYNTAQGLLTFVSAAMPMDAPGSLSEQDYQRVVSYLLVQDGFVQRGTAFDLNGLQGIQLK